MIDEAPRLGIIGGGGLSYLPDFEIAQEFIPKTPFGETATPLQIGEFEGSQVAFISRQALSHQMLPSETPYRANIYSLKEIGVERIVSFSSCGSLREDYEPGDIFIPNQLVDFTHNRQSTFFGDGCLAQINVANPFCPNLSEFAAKAVRDASLKAHTAGTLISIEGPRFSTRAEANTFRSWGISAVNMSLAPEPFLAREAEICFASIVLVTDYDVWHISDPPVTAEIVTHAEDHDFELLVSILRKLLNSELPARTCDCGSALDGAISTSNQELSPQARQRLGIFLEPYLDSKN